MATMVRKQVYLRPGQDAEIKRLAEARETTEAEIIREAVDLLLAEVERRQRADAAWEAAVALMESRTRYAAEGADKSERGWTRDDIYKERLDRYGPDSD